MDEELVHVIASDAHDPVHRPPVLDKARDHVAEKWGERTAALCFSMNPNAVLSGLPWQGVSEKRKRNWFGIFS
jgi:tyrosine-protein phosphatase YwqE